MNDGMSESARVYEDGGFGARPFTVKVKVKVYEDGGFGDRPAGWPHQGGQGYLQAWICPLQGYHHKLGTCPSKVIVIN